MKTFSSGMTPPLKITFMGGCHVIGFMVGKENSFVSVCTNQLQNNGVETKANIYPYLNYKRGKDAIELHINAQSDLLIFQCHYIFNPYIFKKLKSLIQKKSAKVSKIYNPNKIHSDFKSSDTNATFKPSLKFWCKQIVRHIFHSILLYRVVNKKENLLHIDRFLSEFKKVGIKNIIILSPFPCTDIVVNKYRKMGNKLLELKCKEYGYEYIDVFPLMKNANSNKIFTIDDIHLNKYSHKYLGKFLDKHILNKNIIKVNKRINVAS